MGSTISGTRLLSRFEFPQELPHSWLEPMWSLFGTYGLFQTLDLLLNG
jgi:hypothetical protein